MHICSKTYAPGKPARYVVLIDGLYYECGDYALDALKGGADPADLGLEPLEEYPDDDQ